MTEKLWINNEWLIGHGDWFKSLNPATSQVCWQGSAASSNDVTLALEAARAAFGPWSLTPLAERVAIIERYKLAIEAMQSELATTISIETGKPLWEAKTEVSAMMNKVALSMAAYHERTGVKQGEMPGAVTRLQHKPHGVMAVLGPFNFPAHLPNGHIVPALLAGNTVVFKPSELTPLVAQKMMACWQQAGLPRGVLNLVQGGQETGSALLKGDINGVLFTGSYQTGRTIHELFASRPEVIVALEMGGNNPLIVTDVANIDAAVHHTILSAFITAGQRCTCARRLIVPKGSDGDRFIAALLQRISALSVAAYTEQPEPFMGPVISRASATHLLNMQSRWLADGGERLLELRAIDDSSALLSPGVVDMSQCKAVVDEEAFGPLLQVYRADDFEHALTLANQTRFGLAAGLLSDNVALYPPFFTATRAGIVNFNRPLTGASSSAPFGGIGYSGNHRPSAYYAADYCAFPVASIETDQLTLPEALSPGLNF